MKDSMQSKKKIAKKNNNVDINILLEFERLNLEYQRLVEPIKDTIKQRSAYNISHPFERRYVSDEIFYQGANQKP